MIDSNDVYISHITALWVWALLSQRGQRATSFETVPPPCFEGGLHSSNVQAARATLQEFLEVVDIPGEIDVLVQSNHQRHIVRNARTHTWKAQMPLGSYRRVCDNVLVCCPEFCLMQMSNSLSPVELALLTCALAGNYFPADCSKGFIETRGILNLMSLERFLSDVPSRTMGIRRCGKALSYAFEDPRSPMESATALLLTMGRRDGGYHLPRPELNHRVELGRAARAIAKTDHFIIDLYWPQIRFGLEYNGLEYHTDVARDLRRELALSEEGITIQALTLEQVLDQAQLRSVVRRIAELHGLRLHRPPAGCPQARYNLINALFPWDPDLRKFRQPRYAIPQEFCLEA
ncbi:MAG: hypothetical protein LKJ49_05380 [Olsenella sp.]|nr:hypothetical protein [Olsenella sp.]